MDNIDLNEIIAALLFALGAVIALIGAFKKTVTSRAVSVYVVLAAGLAGLFALVIDAALGKG